MATPKLDKLVLAAADGGPLRVDVRSGASPGEVRPAVVICHGFKGFKDWGMFPKLADRLATAGFVAASFNFSGSGVSGGDVFDEPERFYRQKPSADLADLRAVVDYLAANGSQWIALLGHSRGGGLAIIHAARDARIKALVTWAAVDHFLRWPMDVIQQWRETGTVDVVNQRTGQVLPIGRDALDDWDRYGDNLLDVVAAARRVRVPWLVVHGTEDATVPVEVGRILAEVSGAPKTETFVVEGGSHTFGARHPWAGATPELDQVFERTLRFLSRHLR
jgi:dienelactone hydrolase